VDGDEELGVALVPQFGAPRNGGMIVGEVESEGPVREAFWATGSWMHCVSCLHSCSIGRYLVTWDRRTWEVKYWATGLDLSECAPN
jgi:hypothetical protein